MTPKTDLVVEGVPVRQGEQIRIEESYKYERALLSSLEYFTDLKCYIRYSAAEASILWRSSDVVEVGKWSTSSDDYGITYRSKYSLKKSLTTRVYSAPHAQ